MDGRVSEALEALADTLSASERTSDFYQRALDYACALVPGVVRGSVLERQGDAFDRVTTARPASGARSRLAVPIVVDGEVSAVMLLEGGDDQPDFDEEARNLASALGRHIGATLQLLRSDRRAVAALRELELQGELRGALARASDVDDVIRLAVEGISRMYGGKPSAGYLVEGDEALLLHAVGEHDAPERIPLGSGPFARAAGQARSVLVRDLASEAQSRYPTATRSMVIVPLVDGGVRGLLVVAAGDALDEDDQERLEGVAEYVTVALQRAELLASLSISERRFRLLTEHMGELVCLMEDGRFSYVSPSSQAILGYTPEGLVGSQPGDLVEGEDLVHVEEAARRARASGRPAAPITVRARHREGHRVWLESCVAPIRWNGDVAGVVMVSRDVSERQAFEAQLVVRALYDDLTRLPNRTLLLDRLRQACERRKRAESHRCALLFIDLDRFKAINDSLGHAAGDELLRAIAERFTDLTRGSDTVARIGGDEFCLLLEEIAGREAALEAARRVREALRAPFVIRRRELYVGASIGIALGDDAPGDDAESHAEAMLRDADIAMYRAKQRGSGRAVVFDVDMRGEALERLELESELHRALAGGELWLAYQPIVRLDDGAPAAFEALLRWSHPQRGLLEPDAFVPLAEATGLIRSLDRWALRTACSQLADWRARGLQEVRISVNVSAHHAAYGGLETLAREALERAGLPASALALEITESALMDGAERIAGELARLRADGVLIVIDDFGTGYSSLASLQRLPIDALKVDRAFLAGVERSASQQAIVTATVRLAQALQIPVVAEGIENEEQLAFMRELGCEKGQGVHLGAPLPPERAIERWSVGPRG
jgi:diguanylate cyclase (GGDEF)-like protein/PAS domain S-box-containing protein